MIRRRFILYGLLVVVLIIGSGWSLPLDTAKDKPLHIKMNKISRLINDHQWNHALQEADALKRLYRKEKWKLQLLGDETEYEQIDQELEKLPIAIHDQDATQAKMILSTVRSLLHNIYSL